VNRNDRISNRSRKVRRSKMIGRKAGRSEKTGKKADRSEKTGKKADRRKKTGKKAGRSEKNDRKVGKNKKADREVDNSFGGVQSDRTQSFHHIHCCNLNFSKQIKTNIIVMRL